VIAPPGQKEAPQLRSGNGGAINERSTVAGGLFASSAPEWRPFVNFPSSRSPTGAASDRRTGDSRGGWGRGGRLPQAPSTPPRPAVSSLGIACIRAHLLPNLLDIRARIRDRNEGVFDVEVYPNGVQMREKMDPLREPPDLPPRGRITSFSDAAARRLKRAFMELHVPGAVLWSFTCTTHAALTPGQWRAAMKRFRMGVLRNGWAGIWRVELQRRGTPHLHVAFWLPAESSAYGGISNEVRLLWLACTRELEDEAARVHAVKGCEIPEGDGGWAVYMGLHSGKHKAAQLGWLGSQWGIWNGEAFSRREPVRAVLNQYQHDQYLRVVRRMETAERRRHFQRLKAAAAVAARRWPIAAASFDRKVARMARRLKVKTPHSRMIRLMDGTTAARILEWSRGLGRSEPQLGRSPSTPDPRAGWSLGDWHRAFLQSRA
jgi:hypothetical protein